MTTLTVMCARRLEPVLTVMFNHQRADRFS